MAARPPAPARRATTKGENMTDYKPTPHLPDDEGRRLLSELWALYGETGFDRETGKPLKMPRAGSDFWKMRQAETRLQQAIIGVAGRFPSHESFQTWLSQSEGYECIDAYDPLRMHDDMIAAIRDLRQRMARQEECLRHFLKVLVEERMGLTRDFPTPPPVGSSEFFCGESREGGRATAAGNATRGETP
jgi:hypothetical protein